MSLNAFSHKISPGASGAPALFLFHGTGGDEFQLMSLGRDLLPEATLVAPRGDVSEGGALRFFRRTGEGVYDMADLARATAKVAGFVRAQISALEPESVLGLGYSNGANILASTLFADPTIFDAVLLMHPLIPFDPVVEGTLLGKRVLITAGKRDPICPPHLTSRLEAELRELGAEVDIAWHEGGHEIRPVEIDTARRFVAAERGDG